MTLLPEQRPVQHTSSTGHSVMPSECPER